MDLASARSDGTGASSESTREMSIRTDRWQILLLENGELTPTFLPTFLREMSIGTDRWQILLLENGELTPTFL